MSSLAECFGGFLDAAIFPQTHSSNGKEDGEFAGGIQILQVSLSGFFLGGNRDRPLAIIIIVKGIQSVACCFDVEAFSLSIPSDKEVTFCCYQVERIAQPMPNGYVKNGKRTARALAFRPKQSRKKNGIRGTEKSVRGCRLTPERA